MEIKKDLLEIKFLLDDTLEKSHTFADEKEFMEDCIKVATYSEEECKDLWNQRMVEEIDLANERR